MQLIILFFLFLILGYMLAGSRVVKRAESGTQNIYQKATRWIQNLFNRHPRSFREWASGPGAGYFNKDWRQWQAGLTQEEAESFEQELSDYMKSQGYELDALNSGTLKPAMIEIFVEAVTVYSREYRKAKTEKKKPKLKQVVQQEHSEETPAERSVAEKQPSRRRSAASQLASGD
jgi:hypothetical protein